MGLFRSTRRPDRALAEETPPDRARGLLAGTSARLAPAGALAAVCGAGLLASAGTAAASVQSEAWNQVPSGPVVTFANRSTGYVAEDPGFSNVMGVQLDQWAANGVDGSPMSGVNQTYTLVELPSNGEYLIVNRYTGLCLDDYGWGTAPGTEVDLYQCNGQENQDWQLQTADGVSTITNAYSGMLVEPSGSRVGSGLVQEPLAWPVQSNQEWTIAPAQYDLLTAAISVAAASIHSDRNSYSCESGYHLMPDSQESEGDRNIDGHYWPWTTQAGDVDLNDAEDWTAVGPIGFDIPAGTEESIQYYHLYGSTETGESMFYCLPDADHSYGTGTSAQEIPLQAGPVAG
jgi:Ricin-type beta-trefoil lectin domain-like